MVALTLKIALFVRRGGLSALIDQAISAAAFSQRPPWRDDAADALPPGHALSFRTALHGVLENVFAYMVLPDAAYRLPSRRIRHIGAAFTELHTYFREMIAERRASGMDPRESDIGRRDLLGALVFANAPASGDGEDGKARATLDDDEVMGNLYILLLAGHDTTAHTLAFCFALLALYPDVQQRLVEHIESVCGEREPVRRAAEVI